ncbi:hypothetical protein G5T42_15105 [Microbacterium sp. 4R-513]|uniref:hypothetical protein n=1 Tax=Microbacterium sp. 4R-513 TaxID=2567934 RepID=UPI0013E1BB07|nr:hypothetical protein [Microbacterium sp. 4R-513]QIG40639.1 hypothetical protein G5T42_15105 [Microbacterium sp. 4R-513]
MPADDPLLAAYRVIRRLDAPAEAPWPGLLAHDPTGAVLLVDLASLGAEWPGWRAAGDGHVLAPLDLVRQVQGHFAAFPPCGERVDEFLARRGDAPLTDGECLTLAVSALRGLAETLTLPGGGGNGVWWLDGDGRPVFAFCETGDPVDTATDRLLDELRAAASPRLARELEDAIEVASEPTRLARSLSRVEETLFAVASPEPLATTVFAPRRARAATAATDPPTAAEPAEPPLLVRLAGHVDADLADAFSRATTAVWRRFRTEREPSRRKPIVAAAVVAGAVLAGGLLWPSGGPATAEAPATPGPGPSPSASAGVGPGGEEGTEATDAAASTSPPEESAGAGTADLASTLDALLTARAACDDDGCRGALQEDAAVSLPPGPIDLPSADRRIALLDEFGGAAVLRVDAVAEDQASQLVVIVRAKETSVLRDVHDVVEHPR